MYRDGMADLMLEPEDVDEEYIRKAKAFRHIICIKGEIDMYVEDMQPIALEKLDIREFITLQKNDNGPLVKIRFSLDTPWLKKDFNLDLIIWNLSEDNLGRTEQVVRYVLKNFNKLFETAWTSLYYYLCEVEPYPGVAKHTLQEFFVEQVDFESPYYTIQLELNCEHLEDGQARYCFVVSTICNYRKWTISDDNMRVYMNGNRVCSFNDNNDDMQMLIPLELCGETYMGWEELLAGGYEQMERDGFQFAEPFEMETLQVIEYFSCDRPEHWLSQIGKSDWGAGQYLYELLRENKFKNLVGENSKVLMLTKENELISFCTYAEKDDIQPTELTPWVGFVYTFPEYRGHRYMGYLFREIEKLAKAEKVENIFISTGHTGLYEKYGCEFYQMMNDMHGEPSRVYRKHVN